MAAFQFGMVKLEMFGHALPQLGVPPIGKHHAANVEKQGSNGGLGHDREGVKESEKTAELTAF
jgi:hypothetical protein